MYNMIVTLFVHAINSVLILVYFARESLRTQISLVPDFGYKSKQDQVGFIVWDYCE